MATQIERYAEKSTNGIMRNAATIEGTETATYSGIIKKTIVFSLLGFVPMIWMMALLDTPTVDSLNTYLTWSGIASIALLIAYFGSIFSRNKIWLFILAPAYAMTMSGFFFIAEYYVPGILMNALAITTAIFIAVLVLFATDKFRASAGTMKLGMTLMVGVLFYSLFAIIMSLFGVDFFESAMFEGTTGFIFIAIMLVIAVISLLMSFESARYTVESGASKESEWHIAGGLFFSLIYLYYIVVRLLLIIAANSRD